MIRLALLTVVYWVLVRVMEHGILTFKLPIRKPCLVRKSCVLLLVSLVPWQHMVHIASSTVFLAREIEDDCVYRRTKVARDIRSEEAVVPSTTIVPKSLAQPPYLTAVLVGVVAFEAKLK